MPRVTVLGYIQGDQVAPIDQGLLGYSEAYTINKQTYRVGFPTSIDKVPILMYDYDQFIIKYYINIGINEENQIMNATIQYNQILAGPIRSLQDPSNRRT